MEKPWNKLTFDVNNGRTLEFTQYDNDGTGTVFASAHDGLTCEYEIGIPQGDFVMLWNFYRYIKDNNIYHEFINPNGREVE